MHVTYNPEPAEFWILFYKDTVSEQQQYQLGGELPGFRAYTPIPYQRGAGLGSFFKSLFRMAFPVLKIAGKHALKAGSKIAADVAEGQTFKESAKKHGREAASSVLHETADEISGKGLGKRKRSENNTKPTKKQRQSKPASFDVKLSRRAVGSDVFGD